MNLTEEQKGIIGSDKSMVVESAAGSGKTSTLVEKAKYHKNDKILYLSFNKAIVEEAKSKFPKNTKVQTIHSLAYRESKAFKKKFFEKGNLQSYHLPEILDIQENDGDEEYFDMLISSHILNFFNFYCYSNKRSLRNYPYLEQHVNGNRAKRFVEKYYKEIIDKVTDLWNMMENGEVGITHNFYLKKYSLHPSVLKYDWIFVDEGQDLNESMLNVLDSQKAKIAVLGDNDQSIYNFMLSIGSLDRINFEKASLSHSFRFRSDIAALCNNIANLKDKVIQNRLATNVIGVGSCDTTKTKAIIARSNVKLLEKALYYIDKFDISDIYFEGGINNYFFIANASIYDILNLYLDKKYKVKSKFIKRFSSFGALEDYVEISANKELELVMGMVRKYDEDLPEIIEKLKLRTCEYKNKSNLIFSTTHKAKGLEYDVVEVIANDFTEEAKIDTYLRDSAEQGWDNPAGIQKVIEEINILYVAASRAKNKINFPKNCLLTNINSFMNGSRMGKMDEFFKNLKEEKRKTML